MEIQKIMPISESKPMVMQSNNKSADNEKNNQNKRQNLKEKNFSEILGKEIEELKNK